jgi:hypothetical protein
MRARRADDGDLGGDDRLLGRLRQLSLIDLDSLLFGAGPDRRAEVVAAFADDLADALLRARDRMAELVGQIGAGPDPLALATAPADTRRRGGAGEAAGRSAHRLAERADACRQLARLDEACALLLPRLVDIDKRR